MISGPNQMDFSHISSVYILQYAARFPFVFRMERLGIVRLSGAKGLQKGSSQSCQDSTTITLGL